MSVTYVEQVPYGYSKNSYPAKSNQPTHRIVSRAPVYDAYSTSYVEHDVGQDQDRKGNLIVILDPGEEVVVHNHYLGHNAEWREITVVGRTYEAKNLFVHNSFIESIARENLPPVTYVNKIESRDYSLSNLIWHTRQKDASYYDSSYAKYFVKVDLQYEIHPEDSLNKNLEKALVRGTKLILEQNAKQVPNDLDVEWCLQYDHFFEVFDFTLEMRSEEYKRLIALVGIDQKYFLPLPQNLAQLPREYSQPSEFEYLTDFYERYPEKRTTPAPDVASNYRRLDLFLDQNNGILNLDRVTENMCAIDPRWCEFANLDFEVRGNKIEFNWSKPIFASQVSIEESRIYQNQMEKTINYQSQKLVDDFFSDNEYADKASVFLESTRSALANFNSGANDLFNAIESLTLALDNAPPIDETTAGAFAALSNPSKAADLFQPKEVVEQNWWDLVRFYNQNTTYMPLVSIVADEADTNEQSIFESRYAFPDRAFYDEYYLKDFADLQYIRVIPFNNKKDFDDLKNKISETFNFLRKLKDDYEGKVYNFDPEQELKDLLKIFEITEKIIDEENDPTWYNWPFSVELHYTDQYKLSFFYIKAEVGTFISNNPLFGKGLEAKLSPYSSLQQKRISYYVLELLDITNKGLPSDIKLWTDEFTRFPNVEYVPRFKNIARKEKQLRRGKRNQFVINNVLKKEEDESLNDLGKLVSGSLAAQEYVANSVDTAIQVTDDLINDINTIDDAFDKYLDKQAVDNPILIATLRCLIPQVDLALLPETDEVEIIREAIQTVELALETYDSLNKGAAMSLKRLGIPTSGDSSGDAYQKAFEELGEKAMNLAYAIAVKKALQIVQALCLQAQKFILDLLLALLNGSDEERPDMNRILRTGDQAFPQPGPGQSPQIGAFQRASTGGSIDSSPDPEELQKFFNDVANILSPIEFCTMFSRQTTPSYILDIAFNFLTTKYENTLLPHIRNRGELAAVIKSLSDFIDRDMCDQLVAQYQIPTEGYSHTRILCEDTNRLRNDLLAESFGIELAEIESIVANQNQSNMSLLRDTMSSLQQPNEQVVDIYTQVRDTPEAKEYFQDSPSPDIESLILQDMIKMQEFLNDTKRLRLKASFAAAEKGLMVPHYGNGSFLLESPGDKWSPNDPERNYLFLPFTALRLPRKDSYGFDDKIELDEFQKRKYIEDTFAYYTPTNLIYDSKMISEPNTFIDSENYMKEGLFSYLNTSTTNPVINVGISNIHTADPAINFGSRDIEDFEVYDSVSDEKVKFYNYTVIPRPKESSIWNISALIVGAIIGAATAVFTGGLSLGITLGIAFTTTLALTGAALASALVWTGSAIAKEISELFKRNEDMPPISNVESIKFSENNLGEITEGQTKIDVIFNDSEKRMKIEKNVYHENSFIRADERFIFPSIDELFYEKSRDFNFSFVVGERGTIGTHSDDRVYLLHNRQDSLELCGVSNRNNSDVDLLSQEIYLSDDEVSENDVDISSDKYKKNLDQLVSSFSITLRDSLVNKYYNQSVEDIFKQYILRLSNKQKRLVCDESGTYFLSDAQNFPSYDSSGNIVNNKLKTSKTNLGKIDLENASYISSAITDKVLSDVPKFIEENIVRGELYQSNPEQVRNLISKEVSSIVCNRVSVYVDQLISQDTIAELFSDSKLEDKYDELFNNIETLFQLSKMKQDLPDFEIKFSSGYNTIDSGFTDSPSVEKRVEMYFNVLYYIKTYIVEYILKVLPVFNPHKVGENFVRVSTQEIYKNIYKNLEFDQEQLFKYRFLTLVNSYYYFLNQEECIDVNMKDANYALFKVIEKNVTDIFEAMKQFKEFDRDTSKSNTLFVDNFDIPNYATILDYVHGKSNILNNKSLPIEFLSKIEQIKGSLGRGTYDNDRAERDIKRSIATLVGVEEISAEEKPYYDSLQISKGDFLSSGVFWNSMRFDVVYLDGTEESVSYVQLKNILKPYTKYKLDNIRVPVNMTLSRFKVPFVSNKNIGKWKNTNISYSQELRRYYFENLEFNYNEKYLSFLNIDKIFIKLTPCISFPSSPNRSSQSEKLSEENILENLTVSDDSKIISTRDLRELGFSTYYLEEDPSIEVTEFSVDNLFDKSTLFKCDDTLYLESLSYKMREPIYERSQVFELKKSEAEKKIEDILQANTLSSIMSDIIQESQEESEFYKKMSSMFSIDKMSLLSPIVSDIVEKYVFNLDIFNFYSSRKSIKNSILGKLEETEEITEAALQEEQKFGILLEDMHGNQRISALREKWSNTSAWVELSSSNGILTTDVMIDGLANNNIENIEYANSKNINLDHTSDYKGETGLTENEVNEDHIIYLNEALNIDASMRNIDTINYQPRYYNSQHFDFNNLATLPIMSCPVLIQPQEITVVHKLSLSRGRGFFGINIESGDDKNIFGILPRDKFIFNKGDFIIDNFNINIDPVSNSGPRAGDPILLSIKINNKENTFPELPTETDEATFKTSFLGTTLGNQHTTNYEGTQDLVKLSWKFSNNTDVLGWYSEYYGDLDSYLQLKYNKKENRRTKINNKFDKIRVFSNQQEKYYNLLEPHIEQIANFPDGYTASPSDSSDSINFTPALISGQGNMIQAYGGYGIPDPIYGYNTDNSEAIYENVEPDYIKDGFLRQNALESIGFVKEIHFDGFEEDHEDEEDIEQNDRQESITSSENADNNRL